LGIKGWDISNPRSSLCPKRTFPPPDPRANGAGGERQGGKWVNLQGLYREFHAHANAVGGRGENFPACPCAPQRAGFFPTPAVPGKVARALEFPLTRGSIYTIMVYFGDGD
jgi:hypothetical protein